MITEISKNNNQPKSPVQSMEKMVEVIAKSQDIISIRKLVKEKGVDTVIKDIYRIYLTILTLKGKSEVVSEIMFKELSNIIMRDYYYLDISEIESALVDGFSRKDPQFLTISINLFRVLLDEYVEKREAEFAKNMASYE